MFFVVAMPVWGSSGFRLVSVGRQASHESTPYLGKSAFSQARPHAVPVLLNDLNTQKYNQILDFARAGVHERKLVTGGDRNVGPPSNATGAGALAASEKQ